MANAMNSLKFGNATYVITVPYGTCSTAATTVAKVVTIDNFSLETGAEISVKFTVTNTATNPTLNINGTGAKAIYYNGAAITAGYLKANRVFKFIYTGSQYELVGEINTDTNTKNTTGTTNKTGTKLFLAGATAQSTNPTTYSNSNVYITTDNGINAVELYRNGLASTRVFGTLIPYGTEIPANVDLNTTTYLKVGNYYCSKNVDAETLTNCPTDKAFMLQVLSPLSTTIDNETGTWIYRLRRLQVYTDAEYVQCCYSNGTAGNWIYGTWKKVILDSDTVANATAATTATKFASAQSVALTGDVTGSASSQAGWSVATTLAKSGVTAGSYGPSANASPAHAGTFSVPYVTVDAKGRVTAASTKTITLPAAPTTVSGNAGSATKLATARTIDGVSFNGTAAITHYGTCSTAAATAAKTVALTGFSLVTGAEVTVKFTVTNTAASPTLNVNSTGAKPIYYRGAAITAGYLAANRTYRFSYDGTSWNLIGDINTDADTKTTTGTSNKTGTKLFLAGATSQASSATTYSNSGVYIGTDNVIVGSSKVYTASITTTWTGTAAPYTQTITVSGILATDTPIVDVNLSSVTYANKDAVVEAYANIYRITTAANSITVYSDAKTTVAIPIQLKVVR